MTYLSLQVLWGLRRCFAVNRSIADEEQWTWIGVLRRSNLIRKIILFEELYGALQWECRQLVFKRSISGRSGGEPFSDVVANQE